MALRLWIKHRPAHRLLALAQICDDGEPMDKDSLLSSESRGSARPEHLLLRFEFDALVMQVGIHLPGVDGVVCFSLASDHSILETLRWVNVRSTRCGPDFSLVS